MANQFTAERVAETYRSMITLSIEGFRYLALINGGAAVALMALLEKGSESGVDAPNLHTPLFWFLAGLVSCGVAMLFAYLTQLRLLQELQSSGELKVKHVWLLRCAIIGYAISLASFCVGAWCGVTVFQNA